MGTFSRRLHFRSRICNFDCIHPASAAAAGCFVLAGGLGAVLCALPRPRAAPQSFQVGLRGGWYLACPCSRWLASEEVIPHAHRGECWTSRGPCERIEVGRVCSPWILVFLVMMYAVPGFVSRELRAKPRRGRNLGWEPRKFEARLLPNKDRPNLSHSAEDQACLPLPCELMSDRGQRETCQALGGQGSCLASKLDLT